jgi:hypothetical protein
MTDTTDSDHHPHRHGRRSFVQTGAGGVAFAAFAHLVGCGSDESHLSATEYYIEPDGTHDQRTELQSLIDAASAAWREDPERRKRRVRIGAGVLRIAATVQLRSGVVLEGAGSGVTVIMPHASWCPDITLVADKTNALVAGLGTVDMATMDTTLTTALTPGGVPYYGAGSRELSVASLGTLEAGDYFAVAGHETGDGQQPGGSNGSAVDCYEVLRAETVTQPDRIALSWPTKQHHGTTNGGVGTPLTVRAVSPLLACEIAGITFDGGDCFIAIGIRLERAIDIAVEDCSFAWFTSHALDAMGCTDVTLDGIRLDGGCNGGLNLDSVIDCRVTNFSTSTDGPRHHTQGWIGSAIRFLGYSTACAVDNFTIRHMCSGIKLECFRDLSITNGTIDDIDIRPKMAMDSEEHVGIAIDMGVINLNYANWAGPLTMANLLVTNCRADPAHAVIGDVAQTFSVWLHDVIGINASNITVENTGVSPHTTIDDDDDYWMPGVGAQDCGGVVTGLRIKGCAYAFGYFSSLGLKISDFEIMVGPGGGGTNPTVGLWLNQNLAAPFEISDGYIQGGIYFGPDFVPDYKYFLMRNISFDGASFDGPMLLARNASELSLVQGDVCVYDEAAPDGAREVRLANGFGEAGACVVAMSTLNVVGDGAMMLIAPANTYMDVVKVTGAVHVGDLLVTTATTAAEATGTAAAYTAIGRALSSNPTGLGSVRMGPA